MLRERFRRTSEKTDLDALLEASRAAVTATPPDHPDSARYLYNLGLALNTCFDHTGASADLAAAVDTLARAADVAAAAPSMRAVAAWQGGMLAAQTEPARAANLLETAVRLLPETAPRRIGRSDQQHTIGQFAGLASDAAAVALAVPGMPGGERGARALRLLEAGRAILLSQSLDTRDDLTDLRHRHPALAARFENLRNRLDQSPDVPMAQPLPVRGSASDPVAETARALREHRRLAAELAGTLNGIREQDGFASFGLPPANDELFAAAAHGPVVTLNVGQYRSDALLLTESRIIPLELPSLDYDGAADRVAAFHDALEAAVSPDSGVADRKAANASLRAVLEWLWDTVAEPVLGALGHHAGRSPDEEWSRIWWVTGGLLSSLPIHAAGYHGDQPGQAVIDRVVSSYTPSIRALRYARQRAPASSAGQSLIVAMPTTPGVPGRLDHIPAEAERLCRRLPLPVQLTEPDTPVAGSRGTPTKANVLAFLPDCPVAHFACHSRSDPADPSRSLLLLHDHESDPLTVASLVPVKLDQAQLAYLSACRTAVTDSPDLADEAIHLTSAFQLAGFPHVVGTLWEIDDAIAVEIADNFYSGLQAGSGVIEASNAAQALHDAVRAARDTFPGSPSLWAAHLHAGA